MLFFDLQNYNKIRHGFRYVNIRHAIAYNVLIYVKSPVCECS